MSSIPQRFGTTRSGKPICIYLDVDLKYVQKETSNFTPADIFDAYALFESQLQIELRRSERNDHIINMLEQ